MAKKRCKCKPHVPCVHWHVWARHNNLVERGPVAKYEFLLAPDERVPQTKGEADELERRVKSWLVKGRPAPPPPPAPAPPTGPTTLTVNKILDDYHEDHGKNLADKAYPSIIKHFRADFGTDDFMTLFDRHRWKDFFTDLEPEEEDGSLVNRNRHFARWRYIVYWTIGTLKLKDIELPFYNKLTSRHGIKQLKEGPGRSRRLSPEANEEERLIKACEKYAAKDGGMMLGRYFCAVDTGLRRGEMLQLQRPAILTDYQGKGLTLHIKWKTSKTSLERHVPATSDRLRDFLKPRRFMDFPFGQADGSRVEGFRPDWENVLIDGGFLTGHYTPHPAHQWIWDHDEDLHWHDLRHEAGSRMAEDGAGPHELMYLLGHTNIETTKKYLNARFTNLADKMRKAHLAAGR